MNRSTNSAPMPVKQVSVSIIEITDLENMNEHVQGLAIAAEIINAMPCDGFDRRRRALGAVIDALRAGSESISGELNEFRSNAVMA